MSSTFVETVIETDRFEDILEHLTEGAAVFCDLDNTLIEPTIHFGTVQWAENYGRELMKSGQSYLEVEQFLQKVWIACLHELPVRLLDPAIPHVLSQIREKDHMVMGLTARYPEDAIATHSQLDRLGIQFEDKYPNHRLSLKHPAIFEKGVIFTSSFNSKGTALAEVLNTIDVKPKKVIFIDDKHKHVRELVEPLTEMNIEYVGIRYSKADQRVRDYNPQIAKFQMNALPQMISDEDALRLMKLTGN